MAAVFGGSLSKYMPRNLTDKFACFTTFTMIPVYYVFETYYIVPHLYDPPTGHVTYYVHFILAQVILVNVITSFIKIIITDNTSGSTVLPSVLPPNWRFCYACEANSPPRSYHCRICNRCILKRDHHCTFTGNCIGFYNHRYFLSFLLYMVIAGIYASVMNFIYLMTFMTKISISSIFSLIFPFFAYAMGIDLEFSVMESFLMSLGFFGTLLLAMLFFYHFVNVLRGQLGHERARRITQYNLGIKKNLEVVMGHKWLYVWLCPFIKSQMTGDGIRFDNNLANGSKDK